MQGTTVAIVVATAPAPSPTPSPTPSPIVIPNVVGLTQAEAVSQLTADGFAVSVKTQWQCEPPPSCHAQPGVVWQQSPPGNSYGPPGSTVVLWVNPSK